MKFTIIRKVPFKWPGNKSRIVWAHVLAEHAGLALILVPTLEENQPHSIFIAQENFTERIFESVNHYRFDLETDDVAEAGNKLKMLAKSFAHEDYLRHFRTDEFP